MTLPLKKLPAYLLELKARPILLTEWRLNSTSLISYKNYNRKSLLKVFIDLLYCKEWIGNTYLVLVDLYAKKLSTKLIEMVVNQRL